VLPEAPPKGIILALHPAFHSVARTEDIAQFAPKAKEAGYVVIFAEGIDRQWNDGRHAAKAETFAEGIDDVGFLETLLKQYQTQFQLSAKQTLVMGMSNGGMMSLRMICQSEIVGAAVAVVANLPKDLACPASPKPLTLVFGTEVDVVDYAGGPLASNPKNWGEVISAAATEAFFATRNACSKPRVSRINAQEDGTTVQKRDFICKNAALTSYHVTGMGHTWPSEPTELYAWITGRGRITKELDGSALILDAASQLLAHARP
jgi:polyhydroxybutyrate depolymerase